MATDHIYRLGSGESVYIDTIDASDSTTYHAVSCPSSFKSVNIQPIDAAVFLYLNSTDTKYKTILLGSSLTLDLAKLGGETAFYLRSASASGNRIELLFLQ